MIVNQQIKTNQTEKQIQYKKHAIHKHFSCLNYDLSQFYYVLFYSFFLLLVIFHFTTRKTKVTINNVNQSD